MKNRVRELRTEAGITQQQLADLVHVSSRTIISLEKGQYNPSLLLAYRLALVFRTTVEDLYCLAENKEQEDRENEEWTEGTYVLRNSGTDSGRGADHVHLSGGPAADWSGCGGRGGGDGGTCDLLYRCNGGSGEA